MESDSLKMSFKNRNFYLVQYDPSWLGTRAKKSLFFL